MFLPLVFLGYKNLKFHNLCFNCSVFSSMREIFIFYNLKKINLISLFILILFGLPGVLLAQTITGKVIDGQTGEPLPFTNVFVSNTTLGSITDINGNYTISGELPQNFELAASFIGYYTKYRRLVLNGRSQITVNFELIPKVDQLTEVELKARRDKKWERNLKRFEKVFLAVPDDPFLKKINILNPWVLNFDEKKLGGVKYFMATAQEPIKIENLALGYQIEFHLQQFLQYWKGFHYNGLVNFKEIEGVKGVEEARNATFQGSLRYFIQSLINNQLDTLEFEMYKVLPGNLDRERTNDFNEELGKSIVRITRDSLYICELSNNRIKVELPYKIEIHNLKMPWPSDYYQYVSNSIFWLEAPRKYFIVDDCGELRDPSQLVRSGFIGRERVARFLPFDFKSSAEFDELVAAYYTKLEDKGKWNSLRERPHLSLNKSFYENGEVLWFSAQMLYQNPMNADTLSRVLYVDLYGKDFDLVRSEKFEIVNGHVSGVFDIPEQLEPGNYVFRAYTNWSRNYGEDGFFYLPVPILSSDQLAVAQTLEEWVDPEGDIEVNIDWNFKQNQWNTRAELKINLSEPYATSNGGVFNVSVLDADLNPSIGLQPSIASSMEWLLGQEIRILDQSPKYPIEYGVSVEGYFKDRPKRPLSVPLTIVKGELEDYGIVKSDSNGYFWATGLSFSDTAVVSIAALNSRRKRFGNVYVTPSPLPVVKHYFPRINFQTIPNPFSHSKMSYADLMDGDFFELDEFTVSGTTIGDAASNNYGYGDPDRMIGSEQLEAWPDVTLDRIISMYMPGGGMGLYNWGTDSGSPLLIVDGARFFETETETVMNYLSTIIASEVESIKVYTFSAPIFGMQGYAGTILVETKKGSRRINGNQIFDDTQFEKFKIRGFTRAPKFPDFEMQDGVILRQSAVYWNPKLEWDKDLTSVPISFEMSSQTKRLLIKIEGISFGGDPISRLFFLDVQSPGSGTIQ